MISVVDDPPGHLYIFAQRRRDDLATLCVAASMYSCRRDDPAGRLTSIDVDNTMSSIDTTLGIVGGATICDDGTRISGDVHCTSLLSRRRDDPAGHLYIAVRCPASAPPMIDGDGTMRL
jgi:hypothetical protein